MKTLDKGYKFELINLRSVGCQILQFFKPGSKNHEDVAGCSTEEVIRACISRVKFLGHQKNCPSNTEVIYHLRMAIYKLESQTIERKIEEGLEIEFCETWKYDESRKPFN